jgi:hypothetical protein
MKNTQVLFATLFIISFQANMLLHAAQAPDKAEGDPSTLSKNLSTVAERLSSTLSKDRAYHPETMVRLVNSDFDSEACIAHECFNAADLAREVCVLILELAKTNLADHYLLKIAPMLVNLIPSTRLSYPKDPKSLVSSHQFEHDKDFINDSTDTDKGELLKLLKRHKEQYKQEMFESSQNSKRKKTTNNRR